MSFKRKTSPRLTLKNPQILKILCKIKIKKKTLLHILHSKRLIALHLVVEGRHGLLDCILSGFPWGTLDCNNGIQTTPTAWLNNRIAGTYQTRSCRDNLVTVHLWMFNQLKLILSCTFSPVRKLYVCPLLSFTYSGIN